MFLSFQISCKDNASFLQHWSTKYRFKEEDEWKYTENIGKPLTQKSLRELFEWKNGMANIAEKKVQSIASNYPVEFEGDQVARYLSHRQPGSAIWNIFYLHCLSPQEWPIFDQHVFRAMHYMKTGEIREIPTTSKGKYASYLTDYIPFWKSFESSEARRIDMALFAHGKFLKTAGARQGSCRLSHAAFC
jgi:hypothetical protein